jgi:hypothetical protein
VVGAAGRCGTGFSGANLAASIGETRQRELAGCYCTVLLGEFPLALLQVAQPHTLLKFRHGFDDRLSLVEAWPSPARFKCIVQAMVFLTADIIQRAANSPSSSRASLRSKKIRLSRSRSSASAQDVPVVFRISL